LETVFNIQESDVPKALDTYTQARELVVKSDYESEDGKDGTYTLGRMCEILAERKEWSNLISKVASWSSEDRTSWLCTDEKYKKGQNERFMQAASLAEQQDIMKNCYKEALDTTYDDDDSENEPLIRYQYVKASFYVLEDNDDIYDQLQKIVISRNSSSIARETRKSARLLLITLISNQLKITPNLWVKRLLMDDMQFVAKRGARVKDLFNILSSILLAGAYIEAKNVPDAKEQLGVAFDICIEALRDTVTSNDKVALELLARILSLANFEHDAGIAFSAVFSIIDPDVRQKERHDASHNKEKNHDIDTESKEPSSIVEIPAV
jgi:hypothetical protein